MSQRVAGELSSILGALRHDAALAPQLGVVVARLLITAGHVVLRFKQYTEYPCRAALMSKTWNPDGFHQEILRFLSTLENVGHRRRPMRLCTHGRHSASIATPVQEELATLAHAIETSTLDVERKHKYDRRAEAPTVASVAQIMAGLVV